MFASCAARSSARVADDQDQLGVGDQHPGRKMDRVVVAQHLPLRQIAPREMGLKRSTDLSVSRDQLIKKGLLYAPDRGLLAFTVPGMAAYIIRQSVD